MANTPRCKDEHLELMGPRQRWRNHPRTAPPLVRPDSLCHFTLPATKNQEYAIYYPEPAKKHIRTGFANIDFIYK
jgi:hypothetical protein